MVPVAPCMLLLSSYTITTVLLYCSAHINHILLAVHTLPTDHTLLATFLLSRRVVVCNYGKASYALFMF